MEAAMEVFSDARSPRKKKNGAIILAKVLLAGHVSEDFFFYVRHGIVGTVQNTFCLYQINIRDFVTCLPRNLQHRGQVGFFYISRIQFNKEILYFFRHTLK